MRKTAGKNPPQHLACAHEVRRQRRSTRSCLAAPSGCSNGRVDPIRHPYRMLPMVRIWVLGQRADDTEAPRLPISRTIIVAACPLSLMARGSSIVFDAFRQSLRDHEEAVLPLHGSLSPCLDVKVPHCRWLPVGPGQRLGRRCGASPVQPYAIHRRRTLGRLRFSDAVTPSLTAATPQLFFPYKADPPCSLS